MSLTVVLHQLDFNLYSAVASSVSRTAFRILQKIQAIAPKHHVYRMTVLKLALAVPCATCSSRKWKLSPADVCRLSKPDAFADWACTLTNPFELTGKVALRISCCIFKNVGT